MLNEWRKSWGIEYGSASSIMAWGRALPTSQLLKRCIFKHHERGTVSHDGSGSLSFIQLRQNGILFDSAIAGKTLTHNVKGGRYWTRKSPLRGSLLQANLQAEDVLAPQIKKIASYEAA